MRERPRSIRRAPLLISIAAVGIAAVGVMAVTVRADDGACDQLRFRLAAIGAKHEGTGAAQRWEDISTLQLDVGAGGRLLSDLAAKGCA